MESIIAKKLPKKFGIIFDGWSNNSEHFLGVFAVYNDHGVAECPLLAMAPMIDPSFTEAEALNDHSAEQHKLFLSNTLEIYGKNIDDNVSVLIGDNCMVNKKLARICGVPLIGCASHRLNLAVKNYLKPDEIILQKIQEIMKLFKNLNNAADLRSKTDLVPIVRNATRWSSIYNMVDRYFKLKPFIDEDDEDFQIFILSKKEEKRLSVLFNILKDFESVNKALQGDGISLLSARILFDSLILSYPEMESYLKADAEIVYSPDFERAAVKYLNGEFLSNFDENCLGKCADSVEIISQSTLNDNNNSLQEVNLSFAERALKKPKLSNENKNDGDKFKPLKVLPPTSNMVERFFSEAKLILSFFTSIFNADQLGIVTFFKIKQKKLDARNGL